MGEWYEVDESLPKLTEDESDWLKLNIREAYLVTMTDPETRVRCGSQVPVFLGEDTEEPDYKNLLSDVNVKSCPKYLLFLNISDMVKGGRGHQNLLYIDNAIKKIFWIEPKFSAAIPMLVRRVRTNVLAIQKQLGIEDYALIQPEETCIQAVAKDKNCIIWSLLLFELIASGVAKDTLDATKIILARFPTADLLRTFIEHAKSKMYHAIRVKTDLSGGKKRPASWVLSTGNQSRYRKTRRRPSKSKSRRLKSAKRTQNRGSRRSK